jgi:hypothetical protein
MKTSPSLLSSVLPATLWSTALSTAMSTVLLSASASAHVRLDAPQRRYDDQKSGSCGRGLGADGRTDRFSRFEPGETITMEWTETIDHEGSWVVSFDDDGADEGDFEDNILHTEPDPRNESNLAWSADVTLPDIECTNCTLRLVQIMTTSPNPVPGDLYFQCADIVLGDGDSAPAEVGGCSQGAPVEASAAAAVLAGALFMRRRRRSRR